MFSEFEVEEMRNLYEARFDRVRQERYEYLVAYEAAQPTFRRRVAEGLIALGARIDPSAGRPRSVGPRRRILSN